ncbi:MAG: rRNA maturation RNase YbeY [Balneolaceae bacterium]|nr:MAG: rRNA maturation RNase YbeY [Balneolaceae bacterium]
MLRCLIDLVHEHEKRNFLHVEVVFVNDMEILEMNRRYLGHDHVTDIITFPYHENDDPVEGTLFCCAPQIRRQSEEIGVTFDTEVLRIVIHGLLHLVGYDDETEAQRNHMHSLENKYIRLYLDY